MGKTSTASKKKYNTATYSRYVINIRKDSMLDEYIKDFMSAKETSLNYLVTKLLTEHFDKKIYREMNGR